MSFTLYFFTDNRLLKLQSSFLARLVLIKIKFTFKCSFMKSIMLLTNFLLD